VAVGAGAVKMKAQRPWRRGRGDEGAEAVEIKAQRPWRRGRGDEGAEAMAQGQYR
jgi:hypothetical protein